METYTRPAKLRLLVRGTTILVCAIVAMPLRLQYLPEELRARPVSPSSRLLSPYYKRVALLR